MNFLMEVMGHQEEQGEEEGEEAVEEEVQLKEEEQGEEVGEVAVVEEEGEEGQHQEGEEEDVIKRREVVALLFSCKMWGLLINNMDKRTVHD